MPEQKSVFPYNAAVTNAGAAVLLVFGAAALPFPGPESLNKAMQPLSRQVRVWKDLDMCAGTTTAKSDEEPEAVLGEFAKRIAGELVEPAPEIDAFITEHFWDLV